MWEFISTEMKISEWEENVSPLMMSRFSSLNAWNIECFSSLQYLFFLREYNQKIWGAWSTKENNKRKDAVKTEIVHILKKDVKWFPERECIKYHGEGIM